MAATAPKRSMSVLKRARQNEKRQLRNRSVKSKIKTLVKKLEMVMQENKKEEVPAILNEVIGTLDSASLKGIIHKNTASRKIGRLSHKAHAYLS